jgi:hypothetical protein
LVIIYKYLGHFLAVQNLSLAILAAAKRTNGQDANTGP